MKRGLTFGIFDVFHYGHLRILERSRELFDPSTVGVPLDELNASKKDRSPYYSPPERLVIIEAMKRVDDVFVEESLELKGDYIRQHRADILIMGDDWVDRFDIFKDLCEVVYLPHTPGISTTALIEQIRL